MQREIAAMTDRDAILAEAETLAADAGMVRIQLEEARTKAFEDDVCANRDWYRRASIALRLKGARHQMLLRRAAQLRNDTKAANAAAWEKRFVDAARRRLTPEAFAAILEEARAKGDDRG